VNVVFMLNEEYEKARAEKLNAFDNLQRGRYGNPGLTEDNCTLGAWVVDREDLTDSDTLKPLYKQVTIKNKSHCVSIIDLRVPE